MTTPPEAPVEPPVVLPPVLPVTAPFDAGIDGVRGLIPESQIPDVLPEGVRGVTRSQVELWLADFSAKVALALDGWELLRLTQTVEEIEAGVPSPRALLIAHARDLVHNAVASYVEAARFPERALDGYARVLWDRYTLGLAELAAWVQRQLDTGGITPANSGALYNFPPPSFTSEIRF